MFDDRRDGTPTPSRLLAWLFPTPAEPAAPRAIVSKPASPSLAMAKAPAKPAPRRAPARAASAACEGDGRRAPRATLDIAGGITRPGSPAIFPARTIDISHGGALLFTLVDLEERQRVVHLLRFRGDHQATPLVARVAWRRPFARGYEVGVSYDGHIGGDVLHRLSSFIDERFADLRDLRFLLALGRRTPAQEVVARGLVERLGAPSDPDALRAWLARTSIGFRHSAAPAPKP